MKLLTYKQLYCKILDINNLLFYFKFHAQTKYHFYSNFNKEFVRFDAATG